MSLGMTGLGNYTPRGSGTARTVINAVPPEKQKKTTQLQLRINDDDYQLFKELCELNGTDVSKALRTYIKEAVTRGAL